MLFTKHGAVVACSFLRKIEEMGKVLNLHVLHEVFFMCICASLHIILDYVGFGC